MSRLVFTFSELIREIDSIRALARKCIDNRSGRDPLEQLKRDLNNIKLYVEGRSYPWGIPTSNPLVTKPSSYYLKKVPFPVYATLTSIWSIEPIGKTKRPKTHFRLTGVASTKIQLFRHDDNGEPEELGIWRMEIGDSNHPGCYFHVQIGGQDNNLPFPGNVPIPRFPFYFATPPSALGFVLGELFQEEWAKEMSQSRDELSMWRGIQRKRFDRLFEWQSETVRDTQWCPWVALKKTKPHETLFSR